GAGVYTAAATGAALPPVNWGHAATWDGFWWVVSGQPYRGLLFGVPSALLPDRVHAWADLLVQQFGWPGVALALVGLLFAPPHAQRFGWLSAALAAGYSLFAIGYNTTDSHAYLLPVYLIVAVWVGLGTAQVWALLHQHAPRVAPALLLVLVVFAGWSAWRTLPQVDAHYDTRATDFAEAVLASVPPDAIVTTSSDQDTFALWYHHYGLAQRPDVVLVVAPLLSFEWYHTTLYATYSALPWPAIGTPDWPAALAERTRRPLCHTDPLTPLHCTAPPP
ncbi:MAG: hypothetical protein HC914_13265, partial [Chloroflexaceae bacterium]|nr:hypothetical protein [Chloroflexaceae bacterium]